MRSLPLPWYGLMLCLKHCDYSLKVAAKVSTAAIELVWPLSNNHDVRVEFIA